MSKRFFICITAHDPLSRFDSLLKVLRSYEDIPGYAEVYIFIDKEHEKDSKDLDELLFNNLPHTVYSIEVAPAEYEGFYLTWSHKSLLKSAVLTKSFDYYIYSENDMLFSPDNFNYWVTYKDFLKPLNLEPGFCRFERFENKLIPFDNYKQWALNGSTPSVWGDVPYRVQTHLTPYLDFVGFASLGNPYMGMMILDQEMADQYINSESFDPVKSFAKTKIRCWPIADRSSMGLAFEGLRAEQEHRRVVPIIRRDGKISIDPCALIEHLDTKYSKSLLQEHGSLLETNDLFLT